MTYEKKMDRLRRLAEYGNFTPVENLDDTIKNWKKHGHFHIFISPFGDVFDLYKPAEMFHSDFARLYYKYVYGVDSLGFRYTPVRNAYDKVSQFLQPGVPENIKELAEDLKVELRSPDFFFINHEGWVKVTLDRSIKDFYGVAIPNPYFFGNNLKRSQIAVLNELIEKGVLKSSLPEELLERRRKNRKIGAELNSYEEKVKAKG